MNIQPWQPIDWARQLSSLWIPVIYAIMLLIISPIHSVFNEWGGVMQYFCGKEILSGKGYRGWTSHFWPPLFPTLMGLVSKLFSGFSAGKLISITCSSFLLFVAYDLTIVLTRSNEIGLLTQVFLALSPVYFRESLQAHNHMLDALLFVSGLTLFIKSFAEPTLTMFLGAGLIGGLAGLTRYTSYVLLALPASLFFLFEPSQATIFAVAFWVGFSIISLPWWVYNALHNGSPVHNWDHLNVCVGVFQSLYGGSLWGLFQFADKLEFNSLFDVFGASPKMYLKNVFRNIYRSIIWLIRYGGVLAPFVIPGVFGSFLLFQPQYWFPLFGTLALYVILVSQAYVNDYYFLSWTVLMILISVVFFVEYTALILERYSVLANYPVKELSISLLAIAGLALISYEISRYLKERKTSISLADLDQVTHALTKHDPSLETKVIMAIDPARAYYAGAKYLSTPLNYKGSVEGLVSYRGLSERVKEYAPKYPSDMEVGNLRADYLIYTRASENTPDWEFHDLPQFDFLLDPESNKIPDNFERVYLSERVAVYGIHWR
jgi:hypothetical protein